MYLVVSVIAIAIVVVFVVIEELKDL